MSARGRVLVTGAAGFFGLAIVRALSISGAAVVATDRLVLDDYRPRPGTVLERVRYVQRDLEQQSLDDLVADVDALVHAAALTPGREQGETLDELLAVNLRPLPGLLRAVRSSPCCGRIIFVSSAGVYDQTVVATLREEHATGGTSLYGAAKLAAELVIARYAALAPVEACSLRPTSLFGPGEVARPSRPRVTSFRSLVDAVRRAEPVRIENGAARADWLHVDDAADAVALLVEAERLPVGSLNLSSGVTRSLDEIAAVLEAAFGLRIDPQASLVVSGGLDRPARIDSGRLQHELGWVPERTFLDAAQAILAEETGYRGAPSRGAPARG